MKIAAVVSLSSLLIGISLSCSGIRSYNPMCEPRMTQKLQSESDSIHDIVDQEEGFIYGKIEEYQEKGDSARKNTAWHYCSLLKPCAEKYFSCWYMTTRLIFRQSRNRKLTEQDMGLIFTQPSWLKPNPKDSAEIMNHLTDTTCVKNYLLSNLIRSTYQYMDSVKYYNDLYEKNAK